MGSSSVVILVASQPRGAIPPATLRTMPSKVSFKGVATKVRKVLKIPKRSPDLNVMDYFIWAEIQKRMRAQERMMKSG